MLLLRLLPEVHSRPQPPPLGAGAGGREILYRFLGQAHKERIVLLSTSKSTREELSKYMPERHMPPHIRNDTGADTSSE